MRHNKCRLSGSQVGGDRILPVRDEPAAYRGKGLRGGELVGGQRGVARVAAGMVGVIGSDGGRSEVIRAAPVGIDLAAELAAHIAATPALQRAVVAFVEAPAASDRRGARTCFGDNDIGGIHRAGKQRCVHRAGSDARVAHQHARGGGLIAAAVGQREVEPAAEHVIGIGCTLTVPQQHQHAAHTSDSPRSSALI